MKWIKIYDSLAQAKQFLKDGRIAKHFIEEEFVCVVYSNNQFFAFADRCPHQGYSFIGGKCQDGIVECPIHKYKFALGIKGERSSLKKYPIESNKDGVFVCKEPKSWF